MKQIIVYMNDNKTSMKMTVNTSDDSDIKNYINQLLKNGITFPHSDGRTIFFPPTSIFKIEVLS